MELLPETVFPKGRIYPIPERKAIDLYMREALSQKFIRPPTSPAASSFFFMGKKDGGLRPCIDYRILNTYTRKFAYPLPLIPASQEQLRNASIFTKLNLHSAFNLIGYNPGMNGKQPS